jgi:hypothetical protein
LILSIPRKVKHETNTGIARSLLSGQGVNVPNNIEAETFYRNFRSLEVAVGLG